MKSRGNEPKDLVMLIEALETPTNGSCLICNGSCLACLTYLNTLKVDSIEGVSYQNFT